MFGFFFFFNAKRKLKDSRAQREISVGNEPLTCICRCVRCVNLCLEGLQLGGTPAGRCLHRYVKGV